MSARGEPALVSQGGKGGEPLQVVHKAVPEQPVLVTAQGHLIGMAEEDRVSADERFPRGGAVGNPRGSEPEPDVSRTLMGRLHPSGRLPHGPTVGGVGRSYTVLVAGLPEHYPYTPATQPTTITAYVDLEGTTAFEPGR